jgi:hypothetical protein
MAKDPADRFANADDVRHELLRWADGSPGPLPVARRAVPPAGEIRLTDDDLWEPEDVVEAVEGGAPARRRAAADDHTRLLLAAGGIALIGVLALAAAAGYLFRLYVR